MLTTNYYNLKHNNRQFAPYIKSGSLNVNQKLYGLKQFSYVDGSFSLGNFNQYGGPDIIFGCIPYETGYQPNGETSKKIFAIGFDGSNTPASIDDYKLINPITNCSIQNIVNSISGNTVIREFTIRNDNNTEIIIRQRSYVISALIAFLREKKSTGPYFNKVSF